MLIVGNGGVKETKTYEESKELSGYVISLQRLDELIRAAVTAGEVIIEKANIEGIDDKIFEL